MNNNNKQYQIKKMKIEIKVKKNNEIKKWVVDHMGRMKLIIQKNMRALACDEETEMQGNTKLKKTM